jgi:hypothetical protein
MDGQICRFWLTSVWPHGHVTVRPSGEARIHAGAKRRLALFAVAAPAVGDVEGHDDPVALFQQRHPGPDLLDDAHVLVAYAAHQRKIAT